MTLATCQAIVRQRTTSAEVIAEEFAEWFCAGQISGVGASTLKALTELAAGGHWALVGRKGEMAAGNGAAMRVAPLGFLLNLYSDGDRTLLRDICRITHHSDEAYIGALVIVMAIHSIAVEQQPLRPSLLENIYHRLPDSNVRDRISEICKAISGQSVAAYGKQLGTSAYVVESIPFALAAATLIPSQGFEEVLTTVIECGGDTDTNASIAGQIGGAALGLSNLPTSLLENIRQRENIIAVTHQLSSMVK